jgi:hypothetical protein
MTAASEGTFKLVLEAEHGIRTELDPHLLVVKIDQPPAFVKVAGNEELKAVQPYETLPLEIQLADDVGVDVAEVEYRVNNGPSVFVPMALKGRGTREAVGRLRFELAGKVKEGDTFQYRFKAADNRRVPEAGLTPNVVYHPAEATPGQPRWRTLQIARQAEPLRQQEILAQRDQVSRRIDAIQRKLYEERADLLKLRADALNQPVLTRPQSQQLGEIRKQNRSAEIDLRELAREAGEAPDLQPVAERAADIADKEMRRSDQNLERAEKEAVADPRDHQLQEAGKELTAASKRLDDLRRQNEQMAQARLDQMRLEALATREQQLADRAAEQAAQDPVKDPRGQDRTRDLQREQAELARDLEQQAAQSDPLRKALEAARAERARQLADQARELARAERELAQAARDTEQRRQQERLADVAQKQQELADRARQLAQETRPSAQAAKANPLKPDEAQKAAEALKQGNADDALRRQEQAAHALERHAADLAKAVELANDPREAARQLARLQEDLRKRLAGEDKNKAKDKTSAERLKDLGREEKAIQHAAEDLSVPEQNAAALKERQDAAHQAARAADALDKRDARQADTRMTQARQALERLANQLPSLEQRRRQAAAEVARLRQQQDEIGRQAEQAVKQVEKEDAGAPQTRAKLTPKLADAARRQAEVAERLGKIDTPKQEARRARAQDTLRRAHEDLKAARPQDVTASQQDARRDLERLEQALLGKKPADEQARELARRQQELADQASRQAQANPSRQQQQDLQRRQEQIAQETKALNAPEAPQQQREAADATRRAAENARAQPSAPQTQEQMREAAKALDRLARQMAGRESDAARADRLARRQAEAAKEADRLAKKPAASNPDATRNQKEIADEAKQLHAGDQAQTEKQKALQALTRAQQPTTPQEQARAQRQAADALHALADRLARQAQSIQRPAVVRAQAADETEAAPRGLPNPKQAEQARQLAQEQRDLRAAVQRLATAIPAVPARENPVAELAKEQAAIAGKASELARNVGKDQGQQAAPTHKAQQAARSTKQASDQLQSGALSAAHQSGKQAAGELRQLAQQVSQTPRGNVEPKAPDPVQEARQLAQRQEALNRRLEPLAQQSAAQLAQQQARQQELQRQTGDLAQNLNNAAQQASRTPQPAQAMRSAALMSQQAQASMQRAQDQSRQGNPNIAQPLQQHAAQSLDQAARMADLAAQQIAAGQNNTPPRSQADQQANQQAGQAVEQAHGQMKDAEARLGQNQQQSAQAAMQQAAQSLQRAARQFAQRQPSRPDPNSRSSDLGAAGLGRPDDSVFAKDTKKYAGKPWGELPGELRTKIIQDMKAKYGDDYARMIKLYFEQVADRK